MFLGRYLKEVKNQILFRFHSKLTVMGWEGWNTLIYRKILEFTFNFSALLRSTQKYENSCEHQSSAAVHKKCNDRKRKVNKSVAAFVFTCLKIGTYITKALQGKSVKKSEI